MCNAFNLIQALKLLWLQCGEWIGGDSYCEFNQEKTNTGKIRYHHHLYLTIANLKNWTWLEKTHNYSELSHLNFGPHILVGLLAHLRRATMIPSSIHYFKWYMKPSSFSKFIIPSSILSLRDNFSIFSPRKQKKPEQKSHSSYSKVPIHLWPCSVTIFFVSAPVTKHELPSYLVCGQLLHLHFESSSSGMH